MSKKQVTTLDSKKSVKQTETTWVQITAATVFNRSIVRKGEILEITPSRATRLYRMKKAKPYQKKNKPSNQNPQPTQKTNIEDSDKATDTKMPSKQDKI